MLIYQVLGIVWILMPHMPNTDRYDAHRCSIVQGLHMDILDIQDLHRVPGHYPETAIPSLDQKLQPKASKNAFYKTMVPHYNRLLQ